MSQALRDFIATRKGEVRAQIKALNDELRELCAAKSAIDGASPQSADRVMSTRVTHRDMIVSVLDERPDGGTSDKVIEWVNEKFSVCISQTSMSSQLSRAKSDGVLDLEQSTKTWRLAKHVVKENEPPSGGSETGEGATSSDTQKEEDQGLTSANEPDLAGQTQHWKMPGT